MQNSVLGDEWAHLYHLHFWVSWPKLDQSLCEHIFQRIFVAHYIILLLLFILLHLLVFFRLSKRVNNLASHSIPPCQQRSQSYTSSIVLRYMSTLQKLYPSLFLILNIEYCEIMTEHHFKSYCLTLYLCGEWNVGFQNNECLDRMSSSSVLSCSHLQEKTLSRLYLDYSPNHTFWWTPIRKKKSYPANRGPFRTCSRTGV